MKKNVHPEYYQTNVVCACGNTFTVGSTISGTIKVEVCSQCHPFYTGKQKLIDSTGRVDKFKRRSQIAKERNEKTKQPVEISHGAEAPSIDTPVELAIAQELVEVVRTEEPAQQPQKKLVPSEQPTTTRKKSNVKVTAKKPMTIKMKKVTKTVQIKGKRPITKKQPSPQTKKKSSTVSKAKKNLPKNTLLTHKKTAQKRKKTPVKKSSK